MSYIPPTEPTTLDEHLGRIEGANQLVKAAQREERRLRELRDDRIRAKDEFLKREAMLRHPAGKAHA